MRRWRMFFVLSTAVLLVACAGGASMQLSEVQRSELMELNREILEQMVEEQDPTLLQDGEGPGRIYTVEPTGPRLGVEPIDD